MPNYHKFLIFFFWCVLGITIVLCLGFSSKTFFKQHLLNKLTKLSLSTNSSEDFTGRLSGLFQEDPDLNIIILEDETNQISGGMYDASRIRKEVYTAILNKYKIMIAQKKTLSEDTNIIIYETLFLEKVYLHFKSLMSLSAFLNFVQHTSWINWFWAVIYLLIGAALSVIITKPSEDTRKDIDTQGFGKISQESRQEAPKKYRPYIKINEKNLIYKKEAHLKGFEMFEPQLKLLMDQIYKVTNCEKITFFLYEEENWQAYIQKHGNVFAKGSFPVPESLRRMDITANLVKSTASSTAIIMGTKKEILGALVLCFDDDYIPDAKTEKKLVRTISKSTASLIIQRKFDGSIVDDETSFYAFPYFFVHLSNKITSRTPFVTIVFEILNFEQITSKTLKAWCRGVTHKVQLILDKNSFTHAQVIAARVNQARFVLLIETDGTVSPLFSEITREIEGMSFRFMRHPVKICSCVVPHMHKVQGTEEYLRIMDQLIWIAERSKWKSSEKVA